MASALAQEFAGSGCDVVGAFTDSSAALGAVDHDRPDVAVVDALMTDRAALRLAATLRQLGVEIVYFADHEGGTSPDADGIPEQGENRTASLRALIRRVGGH
jgi:DNA-binding NarL/FixJ family response regulator